MAEGKAPRLLLLSRPECHLCEEFRDELLAQFGGSIELDEACVDDRADWRARYGTRIPVLLDGDGEVVCDVSVSPEKIKEYFAQRRQDAK
jgi:hypothetical protein